MCSYLRFVKVVRFPEELERLQSQHKLLLVKAVKTGCSHCEHLAPHFAAAAAALSQGKLLYTRTSHHNVTLGGTRGEIAFVNSGEGTKDTV